MKKMLFLIPVISLLISGCSVKPGSEVDLNNKSLNSEAQTNNNKGSDTYKISSINNGDAAKAASAQKSMEETRKEDTGGTTLEDLAKEYSMAIMKTNFGDIKFKFYGADSPVTVNNFMNLAKKGFYDGTKFHRVIKDFMIQGGDPNSKDDDWSNDGIGGPGYKFQDEFNAHKLVRGSLAMANSGPNTNGSQFFIVTAASTPWLDGKHTNFGEVVEGMDVVDKIENVNKNENDHPTHDVIVKSIELVK